MRVLDGIDFTTLADIAPKGTLLQRTEAINLLEKMTSVLSALHNTGIVHGDLTAESFIITNAGQIEIFFRPKIFAPELQGGRGGVFEYADDVFLVSGKMDAQSDIRSLGVIAFWMLTGRYPFKDKPGRAGIVTIPNEMKVESARTLAAACPVELGRIVLKSLSFDGHDQYLSAEAMLTDLRAFKESQASN